MIMVEHINSVGNWFCDNSLRMLIQSGVLILVLYAVDLLIRKRVRAVVRYCMWMLVLIKLVLPATLCMPTGVGYWVDLKDKQLITKQESAPIAIPVATATNSTSPKLITEMPTAVAAVAQPALPETQVAVNRAITTRNTATHTPASMPVTVRGWLFLGWLVGVLVLTVLFLQRYWFVRSLITQSRPASKPETIALLDSCRALLDMTQAVEMRLTNNMLSPAVCGLTRPVVLMPVELLDSLEPEKLQSVLLHELCHIKRRDLWINLAQSLLQILYFFNPLLWLANTMIRQVREKAVDEMVLSRLGSGSKAYCNTLIDIAGIAFTRPHLSLRLIGVVESKSALQDRIKHIVARPLPKTARLGWISITGVIILAAVLLPMAKGNVHNKPVANKVAEITTPTTEQTTDFKQAEQQAANIDVYNKALAPQIKPEQSELSGRWEMASIVGEVPGTISSVVFNFKLDNMLMIDTITSEGHSHTLCSYTLDKDKIEIFNNNNEKLLFGYVNNDTMELLVPESDGKLVMKKAYIAVSGKNDFIGSIWELTDISGNDADAYRSAKMYVESENMVRLEAEMTNGPATFYGSYNIDNNIISITNTDNGIVMSGAINGDTMSLSSANGDLHTTMKKVQDQPAANTYAPASTGSATELTGRWEMVSASGDEADEIIKVSIDFKPGNKLMMDIDNIDGPQHALCSYTLNNGIIKITDDTNRDLQVGGFVNNDGTLELVENNTKVVLTKVSPTAITNGSNSANQTTYRENNRDAVISQLLGEWKIVDSTIYINDTDKSNYNGTFNFVTSGNVVFEGKYYAKDAYIEDMEYTTDDQGRIVIIASDTDTTLSGYLKDDTLILIDSDGSAKLTLQRTDSLTQEYMADRLTNQLAGKWHGMQADDNGRYEVTLEFKTADFAIIKTDNNGYIELREYKYIIEGKENNRILINDKIPCYINNDSLDILIDNRRISLLRDETESKSTQTTDPQILTTVRRFIAAVQAEDPDGIMDYIYIENDQHKQRLKQFMTEGNAELDYIRAKAPEIVEIYPQIDDTYTVLAIVNADSTNTTNIPQTFIVAPDTSGSYKIKRFSSEELDNMQLAKTISADEYGKKVLNDQREKWLNADSEQLKKLRQTAIDTIKHNLAAYYYAKAHNIEMMKEFQEEVLKKQLELFSQHTPEQLRDLILKNYDH